MSSQQRRFTAASNGRHGLLPPPFRCTSTQLGARAVCVVASGELDLLTVPELERALRGAAAASADLVVLDLHSLTFVDLTGARAIEDASLRARQRGGRLVVWRAPAHMVRLLALTGASCTLGSSMSAMPDQLRLAG